MMSSADTIRLEWFHYNVKPCSCSGAQKSRPLKSRHTTREKEKRKVKIFSVRADENFQAKRGGEKTRKFSANEFMEQEIQKFLDDNPKAQVKHVQFQSIAIVPKTANWNRTNPDIDWEMEKSVLISFEE